MLQEQSGQPLLSGDGLWRLCQKQAQTLDAEQAQLIQQSQELEMPHFQAAQNLYAPDSCPEDAEFLVLTDAIGVKSQKPARCRPGRPAPTKVDKRHDTDVLILPTSTGGERFLCEGIGNQDGQSWSLVDAARAYLAREFGGKPLKVVALTDGAKTIREDLAALFGCGVCVILDWYHLAKRVYQQLSMAAHGRVERESWERLVLAHLWRGRVSEALCFLESLQQSRSARNVKALDDLVGYLQKHAVEIIDYERRREADKPIGSGRMEKGVDQVVGRRQKGKGMSWTKQGSRALALLTCAQLNARSANPA